MLGEGSQPTAPQKIGPQRWVPLFDAEGAAAGRPQSPYHIDIRRGGQRIATAFISTVQESEREK